MPYPPPEHYREQNRMTLVRHMKQLNSPLKDYELLKMIDTFYFRKVERKCIISKVGTFTPDAFQDVILNE